MYNEPHQSHYFLVLLECPIPDIVERSDTVTSKLNVVPDTVSLSPTVNPYT